jgi:hypothetical protein
MASERENDPGKVRPTASGATGPIRNKIHVYKPCHKEFAGATGLAIWLHVHNYILYLSINCTFSRLQFHTRHSQDECVCTKDAWWWCERNLHVLGTIDFFYLSIGRYYKNTFRKLDLDQRLRLGLSNGSNRIGVSHPFTWGRKQTGQWTKKKPNSVAVVRKRTIPTDRPPLVGKVSANFCG